MPRPKGPGVPAHLLVESESERLSYFRQYVIAHPRLKQVDAALSRAIREPAGAALIFVYGPTGVGKTALRRHLEVRLREERRPIRRSIICQ
jgi:Cdc6-like AAA superfamily ATPase